MSTPSAQPGSGTSAPMARVIGRYALYDEIAAGGMAAVHVGRLLGPVGFSRTVAIKRLHAQFARDPEFVSMFLDEARLAARIRHPNVVSTLDVVALVGELFLVMDYVPGESLARLMRLSSDLQRPVPLPVVSAILVSTLEGLHAAHEATDDHGEPLRIVHRDVSPHNILVGSDGVTRVLDFGVAKASNRVQTTREGKIKGKLAYMAPEHVTGTVDRRTDVYAAGVVLWETLTGRRLFLGDNDAKTLANVLAAEVKPPSTVSPRVPPELDALVLRALDASPAKRFQTAREMSRALQKIVPPAPASDVADWLEAIAGASMADRAKRVASIESTTSVPRLPVDGDETPSGIGLAEGTLPGPRKPTWKRWALAGAGVVAIAAVLEVGMFLGRGARGTASHAQPATSAAAAEPTHAERAPGPVTTATAPATTQEPAPPRDVVLDPSELPAASAEHAATGAPTATATSATATSAPKIETHKTPRAQPSSSPLDLNHVIDSRK